MDPTWDLGLLRAYFLNRCDAPTTVMMESHCHLGHPFLQNINELGRPGDLSGKKGNSCPQRFTRETWLQDWELTVSLKINLFPRERGKEYIKKQKDSS